MGLKRWICANNTKNMVVMIVHPRGKVELHDQPVRASEVMDRNPRCVVAHPRVFRDPSSAIVPPDTMLMLGEKFYVVPISTIRKLRRKSFKYCPDYSKSSSDQSPDVNSCNNPKVAFKGGGKGGGNHLRVSTNLEKSKNDNWFVCFRSLCKEEKGEDLSEGEIAVLNRKLIGSPSGRSTSLNEYWQPSLESIEEEKETIHVNE